MEEKYAQWKGVPREKREWHPLIDENKCTGCGMCFTTCGREVFDFDEAKNKAVVARPLQCLVGCTSCRYWCIFDAISFPDPQRIKTFIKENKILVLVKKQLKEKLEKRK